MIAIIVISIIVYLVLWFFVARVFFSIVQMKGHANSDNCFECPYFWWTFLTGFIGIFMVIALPDRQKLNVSESNDDLGKVIKKISNEKRQPKAKSNNKSNNTVDVTGIVLYAGDQEVFDKQVKEYFVNMNNKILHKTNGCNCANYADSFITFHSANEVEQYEKNKNAIFERCVNCFK